MKVILLSDVKKQGKKDDIIEVSDGYANNFLIKNNLAVKYTKTSKEKLEEQQKTRALNDELEIKNYNEIKKSLSNITIKFKVKIGKSGKVFGSISTKQISTELKSLGFDIDKRLIELDHPLDTLGVHIVKINFHKQVIANVKILIEGDE